MSSEVFTSLLLIAIGLFTLTGAVADWDWFMDSRRARAFVGMFGRDGARLFYAVLGMAIGAIGVASLF